MSSPEVSHHDQTRAGVGKTAFGVAAFRAIESLKESPLIYDEFSVRLWQNKNLQEEIFKIFPDFKLDIMVHGLAVRTKKIDEEMIEGLKDIDQVVVIGAGLDFRPWRLHNHYPESELDILKTKKYFEVDFQELFDYKLKEVGEAPVYFQYVPVVANACVDNWQETLISRGFDPSKKSIWLLEGFTGYLTEEEIRKVFTSITQLSASGSKLIATFLGPNYQATTTMHRFKTDKPAEFMSEWNWNGNQYDFGYIMPQYGRDPRGWNDYYLLVAYKS